MLPDLQADRIRAAELDAKIVELERSLCTMRAEKALAQERLDSYKYPVLTLPNEIVSEIFVHFLPVYPACPPLTGTLSPTNLTQVCRKWRESALGTPMLWRAVHAIFNPTIPPQRQPRKIDMWLGMSGCYPTSIEMEKPDPSAGNVVELLRWESEVLVALAPHYARCERLKLHFSRLPHDRRLLSFTQMPLLRHLDLAFDDEQYGLPDPIVVGEMPLLRSVILDHVAAQTLILPWAQLTSITLGYVYPSECAAVLMNTPDLAHCHLRLTAGDGSTLPNITLLRLESLVFFDEYYQDPDCLGSFVLPVLRTLRIGEELLGLNPLHTLASFISKSGCKLQEICIKGSRLVSKDTYRTAFPPIQFSFDGKYEGTDVDSADD